MNEMLFSILGRSITFLHYVHYLSRGGSNCRALRLKMTFIIRAEVTWVVVNVIMPTNSHQASTSSMAQIVHTVRISGVVGMKVLNPFHFNGHLPAIRSSSLSPQLGSRGQGGRGEQSLSHGCRTGSFWDVISTWSKTCPHSRCRWLGSTIGRMRPAVDNPLSHWWAENIWHVRDERLVATATGLLVFQGTWSTSWDLHLGLFFGHSMAM